jgi:tetratricopeptide (TPR) repeat protein
MNAAAVLNLTQSGFQALNAGRYPDAEAAADSALKIASRDGNALFLKGAARFMVGAPTEALPFLRRADKALPGQVNIINMLAMAEWNCGRASQALRSFQRALGHDANALDPLYNLGRLLRDEGRIEEAEASLLKVLALNPKHAGALSAMARMKADNHDLDAAHPFADKLLEVDPGDPLALSVRASIDLHNKKPEVAARRLTDGLALGRGSEVNRALALGRLGDAHDALKHNVDAWAAYEQANEILRRKYAEYDEMAGFYSYADVKAQAEFWSQTNLPKAQTGPFKSPAPVFLIGFPRSGTTLLENILAAHSKIETVEEQDLLLPVLENVGTDPTSLNALTDASVEKIESLRRKYWKSARSTGTPRPGTVFIDKYPLNLGYLGLISRVFPDAKILFALRDPRDAVFSAFKQRFGMNSAMFRMLRADEASRYYDASMRTACAVEAKLSTCFTRYEDMVADWQSESRRILDFLGVDWESSVARYREQTLTKRISTPSAGQVVLPIYTTSIGKWKDYQQQMGSALTTLEKWASHWGYSA